MFDMRFDQQMVYENGCALPVFPYTDGKTADYDPAASAIVRYCVYIETDYDMDNDGRCDLVKAFVQVPRSAAEGHYQAATLYEPRPYCSGTNADAYDHMKEVQDADLPPYDLSLLDAQAPPRIPERYVDTMEAAFASQQSEWYYTYAGNGSPAYQAIDAYDYYLVRGFAVVLSSGFGTYGSDGFEYVGSHYERDAFKAVVEWLHGDRIAYTDRTGRVAIRADWSNGHVAMTGQSYAGTMPFAVATTGVAGLETIVPVAGIADWYSQQNMQGSQRYWPKEVLNSFLCYYCTSQYGDPGLDAAHKEKLDRFLHQISLEQLKTASDYSDFWKDGNYTLQADKIRCSALIVHGLNDENVSTKQFEMMLHAFEKAGQNVRLLLHQGPHSTPTMPVKGYGHRIGEEFYHDIVNAWLCHYLYGLENGAENRPAVLVQNNVDQHIWETADAWETGCMLSLAVDDSSAASPASAPADADIHNMALIRDGLIHHTPSPITLLDTDWEAAGVTAENYDRQMCTRSSGMNRRYLTSPLSEPLTIQGTACVHFQAALAEGDAEAAFHPTNPNDADTLTMQIATAGGRMDDIKLCFLLCDVADEPFPNIAHKDPQRNIIPVRVVAEGGLPMGGDLPNLNICEFETVSTNFCVITRAYLDLCNPASGYDPVTAAESIDLVPGEYHDYSVYLNPARYTLMPGHRLGLVITTEDPINCLIHKEYRAAVCDRSIRISLPVTKQ